jgi:hypothetical protein
VVRSQRCTWRFARRALDVAVALPRPESIAHQLCFLARRVGLKLHTGTVVFDYDDAKRPSVIRTFLDHLGSYLDGGSLRSSSRLSEDPKVASEIRFNSNALSNHAT